MKKAIRFGLLILLANCVVIAAEAPAGTIHAYVDSDLCSRLMLGPITDKRTECSRTTCKDGAAPVLVRLQDNTVFEVNKAKLIKEHVGGFVEASGEIKEKDGRVKLESVRSVDLATVSTGDASLLLDVRHFRTPEDTVYEQIRHELAMMPYVTVYDFISFAMTGNHVILSGWTVRQTNRSTAYNLVKRIEGVEKITNNIDILPLGRFDMEIRAQARARLQRLLGRYFWGSGSDIKIIVKSGNITLVGNVASQADKDIAFMQCNSVPGAFKVFNLLRVVDSKS